MYIHNLRTAALCGMTWIALAACGENPPTPQPTPDPDPNPGTEQPAEPAVDFGDKFGVKGADVSAFFAKALKGDGSEYSSSTPLDVKNIIDARQYLWQIWSDAVKRAPGEKLPALANGANIYDWGDHTTPSVTWQVPEGGMRILYAPKGSKPATGYPLFMYLHGSGSDADYEWMATKGWAQYFKDSPSAYFVPASPQGGTGTRWFQPSKQAKWEQLLRQAFVSGDIDPTMVYFMGVSEGAYGSQRLASFYADYLAGAGPIAGGEMLMNCPPENLANTAFCLQTGEFDTYYGRKVLTKRVGELLDGFEKQHPGYYKHKVNLQTGMGHGCDYTVTTPWLRQYTRNASPKYVAWENFGMGGINGEPQRYRDGFYNLRILTPSDARNSDNLRTHYEERIANNVIDLTVSNVSLVTDDPQDPGTGMMNMGVSKTYTPATTGKLRVYLNEQLVDLSKPVTVNVNGRQVFRGMVKPDMRHMIESCRFYFDPLRLYPAAVDVEVK